MADIQNKGEMNGEGEGGEVDKASIVGEKIKAIGDAIGKAGQGQASSVTFSSTLPQLQFSDERIKKLFGDSSFALDCFKKLDSYKFVFNDKAKKELEGVGGVDDDEHIGILAQELEKVPVLGNAVITDKETGLKSVDTGEMTLANSAALSDVAKEIDDIKEAIKSLAEKIGKGE